MNDPATHEMRLVKSGDVYEHRLYINDEGAYKVFQCFDKETVRRLANPPEGLMEYLYNKSPTGELWEWGIAKQMQQMAKAALDA